MKTQKTDHNTVIHEGGAQHYLKKVAESGSDVHENYTPAEICDMMLDKVDLTKAETVLVLYNIELLFALKKRKFSGHVTFFTQSEEKAGIAPKIFQNITVEYIDKEENPLYHMENKWPDKFDVVIANPPYSNKLDLKFLDKAFDIAKEEVVFVHPSTIFIDNKGKTNLFEEIKNKIGDYIQSLTFFNGNSIFDILLYVPVSITHIKKGLENNRKIVFYDKINERIENIEKISGISIYGNQEIRDSLLGKISKVSSDFNLKKVGNILGARQKHKRILNNENSFFVEFTYVRGNLNKEGNLYKEDFFTIIRKDCKPISGRNPKYDIWFEFSTEKEALNFIEYCKSDFARFCLSLYKNSTTLYNGELEIVPSVDFTQEWTDEKLYAHFNITEEEKAFIKEVIPSYYD